MPGRLHPAPGLVVGQGVVQLDGAAQLPERGVVIAPAVLDLAGHHGLGDRQDVQAGVVEQHAALRNPGAGGKEGLALSLFADSERYKFQSIGDFLQQELDYEAIEQIPKSRAGLPQPAFVTLCINGGRKQKLRAGDLLGALTGEAGIDGKNVGKITVTDYSTYVAIDRDVAALALGRLLNGKIKGRKFKVRSL